MSDFLKKLGVSLERHAPSPRRKYLIGVSGGKDSVALLHGLLNLGYRNLVVCHFNHGLRGQASKTDANFVSRMAKKHALHFESDKGLTVTYAKKHKLSIELAARELRHAFFARCAKKYGTRKIFLAHHADDQTETCLFNYLRGSGMAGMGGMRPKSKLSCGRVELEILRPMLAVSRKDIEKFAKENDLTHREDASNTDLKYTRNRIRHRVLTYLEKALGRDVRKSILRTAEILSAEEEWMNEEASRFLLSRQLSVKTLRELPLALCRRVIRRWLIQEGVPEPDYADVAEAIRLIEPDAKIAKTNLPEGIHLRRREGVLFLEFPRKS